MTMNETAVPPKSRKSGLFWIILLGGLLIYNILLFGTTLTDDPQTVRAIRHEFDYVHWPAWYSLNLWLLVFGLTFVFLLQTRRIQRVFHKLYQSAFWKSGVAELKYGSFNQNVVRRILRGRFTRKPFRYWLKFWSRVRVEEYHRYVFRATILAVILVTVYYARWLAPLRMVIKMIWYGPYLLFRDWIYIYFYFQPIENYMMTGRLSWQLFIAPITALFLIGWLVYVVQKLKKRRSQHGGSSEKSQR